LGSKFHDRTKYGHQIDSGLILRLTTLVRNFSS
jgi:hypothetical protein